MKVSIVSSYDSGSGAGIAAHRLFESLARAAIDVELLVKEKRIDGVGIRGIARPWYDSIVSELLRDFSRHRTPLSDTLFSFLYPTPLLASTHLLASDVVNLHWATNFFNILDLRTLAESRKPVVFTLHDEWSYTGGCHYTAGCTNFQNNCEECPQLRKELWRLPPLVLKRKKNCYSSVLNVVAPSEWIARQARRSALFGDNHIEVIYNPIDLQFFKPVERAQARTILELPQNRKYVLTGSASNSEKRKGIHLFLESVSVLLDSEPQLRKEICILIVGDKPRTITLDSRVQWLFVGSFLNEDRLAMLYSASDVFALPSLEDNLPNMMVESLACGTPIVGFRVGGVAETVVDELTGFLAEAGNTVGFGRALGRVLTASAEKSDAMRRQCRDFAKRRFSQSNTTEKYVSLYSRLAESKVSDPRFFADSLAVEMEYEELIGKYYERIVQEQDNAMKRIASSLEYRIGRASTWPIRRIWTMLMQSKRTREHDSTGNKSENI